MTGKPTPHNVLAAAAADAEQYPHPINHALGTERIRMKEHHPDTYAPSLVPFVWPYCYACKRRVPRSGCAVYLTSKGRLDEDQRKRDERRATGHGRARI